MVLLNEGLNKVRDVLSENLEKGQNGTGTTDAKQTDTGLETPVSATLLTLNSKSVSDKQVTVEHRLDSLTGNGSDFSELEIRFTNGDSLNRIVHNPLTKDSNTQASWFVTIGVENAR